MECQATKKKTADSRERSRGEQKIVKRLRRGGVAVSPIGEGEK